MKQENFVIELTEENGERRFIIRNMQGRILKYADTPDELAQFFTNFKFAV